jgi:hypothetical protein
LKYRKYNDYHRIKDGIEQKQCMDCGNWFDMTKENFNIVNGHKDGFNHRCKICQEIYQYDYYMKTREHQIELSLQRYYGSEEVKAEVIKRNKIAYHENESIKQQRKNNANKQRESGYQANWQKENTQNVNNYSRKHRQKDHRVSDKEWDACKFYFNHRCTYCGLAIEDHYILRSGELKWFDFHKEHVIDNGRDDIKNCIPSCQSCNSEKHQDTLNQWYNPKNPKYTYERYHKIYMWLRYDYKKYIMKRKPKGKYTKKVS